MEPLTMIALGALLLTTIVVLWNHIVHFLQEQLIPLVRRTLGNTVADMLVELTIFIDKRACPTREALLRAVEAFKYHVLGMRTRYEKRDASTVTATTEAFIRTADNKVVKQTHVEELQWQDLPEDIRAQMVQQATKTATVDGKAVMETLIYERAAEEGMTLETST